MKTNTFTFIISIILLVTITFQHYFLKHEIQKINNQISFPFSTVVEVGDNSSSASTPILKKEFGNEYETIMAAALRNDCVQENILILFAIRKAENGPPGLEFGVMCQAGTDLNTQAGWAAATIMKNRKRWNSEGDFIAFLGSKYCPNDYVNWVHNVTYWHDKFREKTKTQK